MPISLPGTLLTLIAVQKFATEVVGPKVRDMDENEMMDPSVISGLFEQGVSQIPHSFDRALTQEF